MIRPVYPRAGEGIADLAEFLFQDVRVGDRRPWVMANMINSVDGATAVDGGATGLTDDDDQALFGAFRAVADVILVGASTVRAEDYGPVALSDPGLSARRRHGRKHLPRLAVVSRSLDIDPEGRFFSDPGQTPLLLTCERSPRDRREALARQAEVVVVGDDEVDFPRALAMLGDGGHRVVLCEGGPTIIGQLVDVDLLDEISLSTSPMVVAGQAKRIVQASLPLPEPLAYRLDRILMGDATLFVRWLRDRTTVTAAR